MNTGNDRRNSKNFDSKNAKKNRFFENYKWIKTLKVLMCFPRGILFGRIWRQFFCVWFDIIVFFNHNFDTGERCAFHSIRKRRFSITNSSISVFVIVFGLVIILFLFGVAKVDINTIVHIYLYLFRLVLYDTKNNYV